MCLLCRKILPKGIEAKGVQSHIHICKLKNKENLHFLEHVLNSIQCERYTVHGTLKVSKPIFIGFHDINVFRRTEPLGSNFKITQYLPESTQEIKQEEQFAS